MRTAPWMAADRGMGEPISLGAMLIAGKKPPPDATNFLMQDHEVAFGFSDWYEASTDPAVKAAVARRLCAALRAHQQIEEEILYPAARDVTGEEDLVDQAEKEHAQARKLVSEIEQMLARNEPPDKAMLKLRTMVQEHVEEEEGRLFPALRASSCDLYALGAQMLARRLDLLWTFTGRAETGPNLKESGKMAIDRDEARDLFIAGLKDMHATAAQGREMLEKQVDRLENYPQVEQRLRDHLTDKNSEMATIERLLDGLGESASGLKDLAMKTAGNLSAMMSGATSDEIHKSSLALSGLTQFSIASLESLITLGTAADEPKAVKELQKCLATERSMAAWLAANLRGLVVLHLQRRSEGQPADR